MDPVEIGEFMRSLELNDKKVLDALNGMPLDYCVDSKCSVIFDDFSVRLKAIQKVYFDEMFAAFWAIFISEIILGYLQRI